MTGPELDRLIVKARAGVLSVIEQRILAEAVEGYRKAMTRLEVSVKKLEGV